MKLYLIRHAHPEFFKPNLDDFDRKLTPEGFDQCLQLKDFVATKIPKNSVILCSTSQRTRQTAETLLPSKLFQNIEFLTKLYHAEVKQLLLTICEQTHDHPLVIIGHNDGISALVSYLTDEYIVMQTCQIIGIELPIDTWEECSIGLGTVILNQLPS